jgi:alkyl hydroperoxide reductase subunit D
MSVVNLKERIAEHGKDIRINLGNVLSEEGSPDLNTQQILSIALASAYTTKNSAVIENILAESQGKIGDAEIGAAKAAATIMAMNNIYYRFIHLVEDKEYSTLAAGLRMQILANPGVDKTTFELMSLAVSAINGCGMCMEAHVKTSEKHGVTKRGVQSTVRIAAVINAAAQALYIDGIN